MPALQLFLLGALDVRYDNVPLSKPPTLKSQSLLAYLVLHRHQPQPRERLAGVFWGDRPDRKARRSLTTALSHIRRCLPEKQFLLADTHTVQFDPEVPCWLDVDEFEAQVGRDEIAQLQSAVRLCRGDFMDGFYDDWILNERYRLEVLFSRALGMLMGLYESQGEYEAALATALRLVEREAWHEDAHRVAMRAYGRLGQRGAALKQYHRCRELVLRELGAEPTVETQKLYQEILDGRFEIGPAVDGVTVGTTEAEPAPARGRSPLDMVAPSRLVGREGELALLHERWKEAKAGHGGLAIIHGEAGVGKTRLVEEFALRLRREKSHVLWGRCYEFERVLPYQPFAEALRAALPILSPGELGEFPAWIRAQVGRLVPELLPETAHSGQAPSPLELPDAPTIEQEQELLFLGVSLFLSGLGARRALLFVLEDLHWAPETTLQLLHFLARHVTRHPLLIVSSLRPEALSQRHPLHDIQRRLSREGIAHPMLLPSLSPEAVHELVMEMSGAGDSALPLAQRLYSETRGNPFFLMEIVKSLFEMGVISLHEGRWQGELVRISRRDLPLPPGISAAIQARVCHLSNGAQEAVDVAAVLGREFDLDPLSAVLDWTEGATLDVLDELLRSQLISEGTGPLGRDYAFSHHKIQEVVYASMPRRRRQRIHCRAALAMEHLYALETAKIASELAFHFEQARQLDEGLTGKALGYLQQAGDEARGLYAHQEAVDYYERALALLKEQGDFAQAARTLMKLGLTYHNAFKFEEARRAYAEGFALWQQTSSVETVTTLPPAPHALRLDVNSLPMSLDPVPGLEDPFSVRVISQIFSGLLELGPEMQVLPDVAQSWEVLEGGRKYLFHLREDVVWSDGQPVTAEDFCCAWKRVLSPDRDIGWAYLLYDIKGASAFHRGHVTDPASVGLHALDPLTLAVELEEPCGYFLYLSASFAYPVPRHVVEARGAAWADAESIVTNGPFRLKAWQPTESIVLERNPTYHGRFSGNVERVEMCLLADQLARWAEYEADNLDVFNLSRLAPSERDRARQQHPGEQFSVQMPVTRYIDFDVSRPPFDDVRVRRAFVLATDRHRLADVILRGYSLPATGGLVPPGMPGHSAGIGLPYDPERARQLLAQAGYPAGRGFPTVEALGADANVGWREYLQAQWRENLGVDIPWQPIEWSEIMRRRDAPPHLFYGGWIADYPDPDTFMRGRLMYQDRFRDWTRWRNASYERLVEKARHLMNHVERMELYRQADRILVEEAPILPLHHPMEVLLVKPWVTRYAISPLLVEQYYGKYVIIEPH
jgi:ABC-type oligopeptide transport system substrate-binding subunit/DNA-binding SARP family transcriptional activator